MVCSYKNDGQRLFPDPVMRCIISILYRNVYRMPWGNTRWANVSILTGGGPYPQVYCCMCTFMQIAWLSARRERMDDRSVLLCCKELAPILKCAHIVSCTMVEARHTCSGEFILSYSSIAHPPLTLVRTVSKGCICCSHYKNKVCCLWLGAA